jgi:hypothetical protein
MATVAAVGLASIGCTMCPDPFDYSGPVPNGSSPQNDFRARSQGILPLGAAPRPWPLLVKDGGDPATQPQENDPTPSLADAPADSEAGGEEFQQTVAVLGESDDEAGADGQPEAAPEAAGSTPPTLEPVPVVAEPTARPRADSQDDAAEQAGAKEAVVNEGLRATLQAPVAPVVPPASVGETPGWRSRRR